MRKGSTGFVIVNSINEIIRKRDRLKEREKRGTGFEVKEFSVPVGERIGVTLEVLVL